MKKSDIVIGISILFILFLIAAEGLFGAWRYVVVDPTNNRRGHMGITTVDTSDIISRYGITVTKYFTGDVLDSVVFEVDTTKMATLGVVQKIVVDTTNPLINLSVLNHKLIIKAVDADMALIIVGPDGGDFTVIIHDTLTTASSDSAFEIYDDDITSVWIDEDGIFQKAITGFPVNGAGLHDTTIIKMVTACAANGAVVWINTHYGTKKNRLITQKQFLEELHHYSFHSGFEIGEGTSSNLGFDFGAAGTKNVIHAIHGWQATHADSVDLAFIDDIYSGGSGTTFNNNVYGNGIAMTNKYYSKFRLWIVTNNAGLNEFHITRSTSEYEDVAQARTSDWPIIPSGYEGNQIDLLGVVYKKGKTWDDLDLVKDWIITDFTAKGISRSGGVAGLGVGDVSDLAAGIVKDSLDVFIVGGSSTFNSITGRQITHNLGVVDHFTLITQTDSSGYVGEIHVRKGATIDTVFNSGSETTSAFMWIILPNR